MIGQDYSAEILVTEGPAAVYQAITVNIDKWWTELSNKAQKAGDDLVVRFENSTSWVMKVTEAIPNSSVVWDVVEANHNLTDINKKDEWKGTTIKWEIGKNDAGSKVTLKHNGLVPDLECFEICEAGWGYFLGSLKRYLETGKGSPYKPGTD